MLNLLTKKEISKVSGAAVKCFVYDKSKLTENVALAQLTMPETFTIKDYFPIAEGLNRDPEGKYYIKCEMNEKIPRKVVAMKEPEFGDPDTDE